MILGDTLTLSMAATAQALDSSSLRVEWKPLNTPPLPDVAKVLQGGLQNNFSQASVEVLECPDLSKKPWGLAAKGSFQEQTYFH